MVTGCSKFKSVILKVVDPKSPESCKTLHEADIVVGNPADLDRHLQSMTRVKWMHSTWAGVELLVKHPPPSFLVTRTGGHLQFINVKDIDHCPAFRLAYLALEILDIGKMFVSGSHPDILAAKLNLLIVL
eukprot:Em0019g1113a